MGLNDTPGAERVHIGFFGRRNAGKSSVVNAVTGQEVALVSEIRGTTTDPVSKAMELLPLGPVTIIDTPGFDDEGRVGAGDHNDGVLGVIGDGDQAGPGGLTRHRPHVSDVDSPTRQAFSVCRAAGIRSHAADHRDLDTSGPGGHGLVGALATGQPGQAIPQHGLPRSGVPLDARHEVDIE